ncbi:MULTISPECIES: 2-keto-4-pentenoate hydratase [unclassified Sinorhizobium]|uniref:2-keto-4-pentenoate hydratase n=1 Tax=unclassified Sinorhizobium TaxID=2613772 RepID=UPI0035262C91
MTSNRIDAAAKHLLDARRNGFRLEGLSSEYIPADRETAFAIQDALIAQSGEEIGGWKIAADAGPDPLCSPLLASAYRLPDEPLGMERTMATIVEAEVAVSIGSDLPPRDRNYTDEEIEAAIAAARPALEVLGTRFNRSFVIPPLLAVADLQNNSAVVAGPEDKDWRKIDFSTLPIRLGIGGDRVLEVDRGASKTEIVTALTWLANTRARRHGGLKAGQIIITGSRVNLPIGQPGDRITADFGALGTIAISLI